MLLLKGKLRWENCWIELTHSYQTVPDWSAHVNLKWRCNFLSIKFSGKIVNRDYWERKKISKGRFDNIVIYKNMRGSPGKECNGIECEIGWRITPIALKLLEAVSWRSLGNYKVVEITWGINSWGLAQIDDKTSIFFQFVFYDWLSILLSLFLFVAVVDTVATSTMTKSYAKIKKATFKGYSLAFGLWYADYEIPKRPLPVIG